MTRAYLLCGPSLAGKSTAAARIEAALGAVVVSADRIHEERGIPFGAEGLPDSVWAETLEAMLERTRSHLAAGRSVVLDDTLCFRWLRDDVRETVGAAGAESVLLVFAPGRDVLLERDRMLRASGQRPVLSRKFLVEHVDSFEWPTPDEDPIDVTGAERLEAWLRAEHERGDPSDARPAVFETERMIAREWALEDAGGAWDLYRRPEVVRYIGGKIQATVEEAREHLRFLIERNAGWPEGYGSFPLFLKDGGRLIGTAVFKRLPDRDERPSDDTEIGWHLHPDVWGRGLATEAGRALIRHGFERLGLDVLHAVVEPDNVKSSAVALRLGMDHVGRTTAYYGGIELELYRLRRGSDSSA